MAEFKHLQIYKDSYFLFLEYNKIIPLFSKKVKYFIGINILNDLKEIIELVIKLSLEYIVQIKIDIVRKLIIKFEILNINFRILKDLKEINVKKYLFFCEKINECLKQLEGLRKFLQKNSLMSEVL